MQRAFDLIVERLEKEDRTLIKTDKDEGWCEAIKRSISIVNQVASEYGGGWIPCSERLPERYKRCFVTVESEDGSLRASMDFMNEDDVWEVHLYPRVIAWKYVELPKPYKAESEE